MIRAISRPFSALSLEVDSTIAPGEAPTAKLDPGQTPPACAHYGNWWVLAAQVGPAERDHMPNSGWPLAQPVPWFCLLEGRRQLDQTRLLSGVWRRRGCP